jgi:outer membrane lipoprotein-sorting protein
MKQIMSLALGLLATVFLSPALAQDNEAEKLFRGMEKKLLAAKAFEVTFDYQFQGRKAKGELLVTQENKMRLKVIGHFEKQKAGFELVADGKQLKTKGAKLYVAPNGQPVVEAGGQSEWQAPKNFHAVLGGTVSRGGMWFTVLVMPYLQGGEGGRELNLDGEESKMKVYDFKLVGAEKAGEKEAKVVRYQFGSGRGRDDEEITLWIDAKTLLPLKRSYTLNNSSARIVENYHEFKLDPKIDTKAFELSR